MAQPEAEERARAVILDSNFLFIPLKFRVNIFEELARLYEGPVKCIVPASVVDELHQLRIYAKPSMIKQIDFALTLAGRCEKADVLLAEGETVDDSLMRLAKTWKCAVATNDAGLRRRLRAENIPVIYLRQKAYLAMSGTV